jgi:hypothetical protein
MIRVYTPWPISWSHLKDLEQAPVFSENIFLKDHIDKNLKVKIYNSHIEEGNLKIDELQVEGKNKISWEEFRNGYLKSTN